MKRILISSTVIALTAAGLVAANAAAVSVPGEGPGPGQGPAMQGTYGFWPASQPANSSKVGMFVARRTPGKPPELYYCSTPADASSKEPAVCKKMENFPE
jgi:hypothetical protein